MPEVTQLERALRILQLPSTGARLTVNDLYEHFDRKGTIQRDLLMLSGAGFPLVSEKTGRGNENVWYFMREFTSFFPVPIQLEELMAAHLLRRGLQGNEGRGGHRGPAQEGGPTRPLVAYHRVHDDFFLLAFQRMEGLEVLDKDFVPEREFDMASFREGRLGLMSAGPVKVRLRFSPDISHSVRGRLWHPSQRARELEDGSLEVEMKVGITDELIGWIMSWQDYAEVLEPQRLREELRRRLKRMVRMYEDAPALT